MTNQFLLSIACFSILCASVTRSFADDATGVLEEMKNGRGGHLAEVGRRVQLLDNDVRKIVENTDDAGEINASFKRNAWNELAITAGPTHSSGRRTSRSSTRTATSTSGLMTSGDRSTRCAGFCEILAFIASGKR